MSVRPGSTQDLIQLNMAKQYIITDTTACEFKYEWTISNFDSKMGKNKLQSEQFSSQNSDFHDGWVLELFPLEWDRVTQSEYRTVQLHLQSFNNTSPLLTECTISINNKDAVTKKRIFIEFPEEITWYRYIPSNEMLNSSYLYDDYGEYDEFKICCSIKMMQKQRNNSDQSARQLTADLKELLTNEKSTDVTIQVGQKSFRAIKGILGVRSPVFGAMFNHEEFKENKKNEVVIDDIEEKVFEEFLHFIYTGESPNVDKMPMELLAAAEKYQIDCLKNICEEVICKTITVDDVASIFVCSDRYNLEKLNKKCFEFMKENLRDVMSNKTFQVYKKKYSEIFVDVLEELLLS